MFYVYILKCSESYYTGHTENLEQRLAAHNIGLYDGDTATRRPVQLIYAGEFPTRIEALEAERKTKAFRFPLLAPKGSIGTNGHLKAIYFWPCSFGHAQL